MNMEFQHGAVCEDPKLPSQTLHILGFTLSFFRSYLLSFAFFFFFSSRGNLVELRAVAQLQFLLSRLPNTAWKGTYKFDHIRAHPDIMIDKSSQKNNHLYFLVYIANKRKIK